MSSLAMDKWIIFAAMMLAVIAAVHGARCVHQGIRSRWTVVWRLFSFFVQLAVLSMRSQMRGSCPLGDTGEMFVF
jgi:hypothetical protein